MVRILHKLLKNKQTLNRVIVLPFLLFICFQAFGQGQIECNGQIFSEIKINDLVLESGADGQLNAVYRQTNAHPGVDALVEIITVTEGMSILILDQSGSGYNDAFQPFIRKAGGYNEGLIEFQFTFVETGTNNSTDIDNACVKLYNCQMWMPSS